MKYGFAVLAAVAMSGLMAYAGQPAASTTTSTGKQVLATPSATPAKKAHDEGTWSTEGSGSCDTGTLTCNASGRQIGCNAQGDYVYCSYETGDVGEVYCYASSDDGSTSSYSDACP